MEPIALRDGAVLRVRPLNAGDAPALAAGFARLSQETRARRFLGPKRALGARELRYLTDIDHHRHEALVAIDAATGRGVAVARYAGWTPFDGRAEVAVTVDDAWQGRGVGSALGRRLIGRAVEEGIASLEATTAAHNAAARAVLARLGFRLVASGGFPRYVLALPASTLAQAA